MDISWRYAASPINWCNDDLLDLGDNYSVYDILHDMKNLGLSGTELGRKYPRTIAELQPLLMAYHIELVSGWVQVHLANRSLWEEELEAYAVHVEFLKNMGARVVVTAEGSGSVHWDRDGDRNSKIPWNDEEWENVQKGLEEAGKVCRQAGLHLVYHPHLGTNIETAEDIDRLMRSTDPDLVSLVLDTGHLFAAGTDPRWLLSQYGDRIRHVHLKSVRLPVLERYRQGLSFLDAVRAGIFTVPGDGSIDFSPILHALSQQRYQGWCVIEAEQDPAQANPVEFMDLTLRYLERCACN